MIDMRKEVAALICHSSTILNPQRWLAEEVGELALHIPHLDELPLEAILALAKLFEAGESDAQKIALSLDIDQVKVHEYLVMLCDFKFADEVFNGYRTTLTGEQAFEAVGQKMFARELHEVKTRLQQLERLQRYLSQPSSMR